MREGLRFLPQLKIGTEEMSGRGGQDTVHETPRVYRRETETPDGGASSTPMNDKDLISSTSGT